MHAERLAALRELFPEALGEDGIDFDRLRAALGDEIDGRPERYTFSWAGKRDAMRIIQTPTRATLTPAPDESVDWDTTQHLFIEGDNLEVLKLLYKPYFGRVKMIYIDPPYNTGNDFIYPDNYADPLDPYLKLTGQKDSNGNLLTSNPETSGRYHSSWLSMMYPRLFLARQLLREDGVIFVSIDYHEIHNLLMLMNAVFGEQNQEAIVAWRRRHNQPNDKTKMIAQVAEFVIAYARDSESLRRAGTFFGIPLSETRQGQYSNPDGDPQGDWDSKPWKSGSGQSGTRYRITSPSGVEYDEEWLGTRETFEQLVSKERIFFPKEGAGLPRKKYYLSERMEEGQSAHNFWDHTRFGSNQEASAELSELFGEKNVFDNPKPVRLIETMASLCTSAEDVVLDFMSGSATAAQAVLKLNREDGGNRRFIMVQLPEATPEGSAAREMGYATIADIGKERIRRVIARMRAEANGKLPLEDRDTPEDLGFRAFKLTESNYRPWTGVEERDPDSYVEQMALHLDPLLEGWTTEGVIWEVALKEGFGLSSVVEHVEGTSANVFRVVDSDKDQTLHICLDDAVPEDMAGTLGLGRDDLFVCRDAALTDDLAANLALQCRLKTI